MGAGGLSALDGAGERVQESLLLNNGWYTQSRNIRQAKLSNSTSENRA
jgi:hypothetical protein